MKKANQQFRLPALELTVYLFITLATVILINIFRNNSEVPLLQSLAYINNLLANKFSLLSGNYDLHRYITVIVELVFWFVGGIILVNIFSIILSLVMEIRQDIQVSTKFVHPRSYNQKIFWLGILKIFGQQLTLTILLILSVICAFTLLGKGIAESNAGIIKVFSVDNIYKTLIGSALIFIGLIFIGLSLRLFNYLKKFF